MMRVGAVWHVVVDESSGGSPRDIWSGPEQPMGALVVDDMAYWLRTAPALAPNEGVFPPLGQQVEVVEAPLNGKGMRVVSTVMEPLAGEIVGAHQGDLWLAAKRTGAHNVTTIYRIAICR